MIKCRLRGGIGADMKNMILKKRIPVFMAVMLAAVTLLAGCGNQNQKQSDTIRWFNASYAILTELNNRDYTVFGGGKVNELSKQIQIASLEQSWGVTDRKSADETLDWVLEEGHRTEFVVNNEWLEEYGLSELEEEERVPFILYYFEVDEEEAQILVNDYAIYEEYGEHAIDAWDYSRAMNLLSFYYVAGYYTREEALDKSLEIAAIFQPLYSSWDEMVESYLLGYEYWAEESSDERRAVYEDLKGRDDNPYAVDYNTTLEKDW